MADRHHIEAAITAQEGLRGVVPDEVVDAAVAALRGQLTDLDAISQRRRQVTVLFADVSGFTALSETLDPELLTEWMNDLWDRLDDEVTRFGGQVDKHMGDAVNLASRLEHEAPVRGVLVSHDTYRHVRGRCGGSGRLGSAR